LPTTRTVAGGWRRRIRYERGTLERAARVALEQIDALRNRRNRRRRRRARDDLTPHDFL
jgi:hypothetical protein